MAIAFAQRNFERQGFQDSSLQKWPPRKKTYRGRDLTRYRRGKRAGKLTRFGRQQKGRALLVKSGKMRAGFTYKTGPGRVSIYNYRPYALAHNRGTDRLPQRKMLGPLASSRTTDSRVAEGAHPKNLKPMNLQRIKKAFATPKKKP